MSSWNQQPEFTTLRYLALATDYDGTLATDGQLSEEAIGALKRLRASGRRVILVTGRRLVELLEILPQIDLFDCVVAENGAVLYIPQTREETVLCHRYPSVYRTPSKSWRGADRGWPGRSCHMDTSSKRSSSSYSRIRFGTAHRFQQECRDGTSHRGQQSDWTKCCLATTWAFIS